MMNKFWESKSLILYAAVSTAVSLFLFSLYFSWILLETDSYTFELFKFSLNDSVAWTHSARIKFIHNVWYREYMDDWRPIFVLPLHQILTWLGYENFGLTLTGHRFVPYVFVYITKILTLYIVYKEFPKKYLIFSSIFLVFYTPLNELARLGMAEATQMGLYFTAVFFFYLAVNKDKKIYYLLAGVVATVAATYKLSGILFILFPLLYFIIRYSFRDVLFEIKHISSPYYSYMAGVLGVFLPYLIFWQIPYLDETLYAIIKDFGVHAGITPLSDVKLLLTHFVSFFSSRDINQYVGGYHSYWLLSYAFYLVSIVLVPKDRIKNIDYILLAIFIVFVLQVALYDMSFRRYIGLMPFAILALFRSFYIVVNGCKEYRKKNVVWGSVFSIGIYFIITFVLKTKYEVSLGSFVIFSLFIVSFIFYYFIGYYRLRLFILSFMFLVFSLFSLDNYFYLQQYFTKITYGIRNACLELGNKIGNGRIIELYAYSLYNNVETGYTGTRAGQIKPDGWTYDEKGQTLEEFANEEYKHNFWALKLKLFGFFYPKFFSKWYLPDNYKELYHSEYFDYIANKAEYEHDGYNYYSKRNLFIGMSEPKVYVPEGMRFSRYDGREYNLKYQDNKDVVIKLPDALVEHHWYNWNDAEKNTTVVLKLISNSYN